MRLLRIKTREEHARTTTRRDARGVLPAGPPRRGGRVDQHLRRDRCRVLPGSGPVRDGARVRRAVLRGAARPPVQVFRAARAAAPRDHRLRRKRGRAPVPRRAATQPEIRDRQRSRSRRDSPVSRRPRAPDWSGCAQFEHTDDPRGSCVGAAAATRLTRTVNTIALAGARVPKLAPSTRDPRPFASICAQPQSTVATT